MLTTEKIVSFHLPPSSSSCPRHSSCGENQIRVVVSEFFSDTESVFTWPCALVLSAFLVARSETGNENECENGNENVNEREQGGQSEEHNDQVFGKRPRLTRRREEKNMCFGKSFLEIGAGTGLPSLVAAR